MQNLSDEELMLNYQRGEALAMDEILKRYKNPVYGFALRLLANSAEAEDIAQEVFMRVHKFRDNYRPSGKFRSWVFSIAHNLCVSSLRKRKWLVIWPRNKENPDELMDFQSPDPSPDEQASNNEVSNAVKTCIQELPFLQKEALILREYQNLDYDEIGKILHRPLGTVKTLIYRARQNLKEKLLPYLEVKEGLNE
jgi:RNA polymerase sigma-70 factor (ECF subfamily)